MARRSTVVKDEGDPGNYYFTEPTEQTVLSKKTFSKAEPVNLFSYREKTNCRTISVRNSHIAKVPEKLAYLLSEHPTLKEIEDYLALMAVDGYGERAIVARKYFPMENTMGTNNWGVILLEHKLARGSIAKWAPYTVRWMMLGEIESAWAEDLVIIHPALNKEELREILDAQGVVDG